LKIPSIALAIGSDLLLPEFVQLMLPDRKPIAVPEIAVNENRNLFSWENCIRGTWQPLYVFSKAIPAVVQFRSDRNFKASIL